MKDNTVCAVKTKVLKRIKYGKTRAGRLRYIKDSLGGIDVTPRWLELIICLILSPFLILLFVYACLKWLGPILKRFYFKHLS